MAKVGLVLGGGGVRGLAHIGVLKVLEKMDLKISAIAGCSMGAIVGAAFAAGKRSKQMEEFAGRKDFLKGFELSLRKIGKQEGVKFMDMVMDFIGVENFKDLVVPLYINATNITKDREEVFSTGKIRPAIRASISLPGIFAPARVNGDLFLDGSILNQNPFSIIPKGIDKYIIVNVSPYHRARRGKSIGIVDILETSVRMMQNEITRVKLSDLEESKYVYIKPSLYHFNIIARQRWFTKIIRYGQLAAKRKKKELESRIIRNAQLPIISR